MTEILGPRDAAVARELTKRHEEIRRGTLADLAKHNGASDTPKGEIVVVIGPPDSIIVSGSARVRSGLIRVKLWPSFSVFHTC